MTCPLCQKRPIKRACPALQQEICATCCATKRIVEISCPDDCRYLESGQKYPAAVVKRQIDKAVTALMALRQVVDEVTKSGGSRAEREVAVVLRGIERGAQHQGGPSNEGPTGYPELVTRVLQQGSRAMGPSPIVIP